MKKRKIIAKLMVLSMIISNVSGINVQANENIYLTNDNIIEYTDKAEAENSRTFEELNVNENVNFDEIVENGDLILNENEIIENVEEIEEVAEEFLETEIEVVSDEINIASPMVSRAAAIGNVNILSSDSTTVAQAEAWARAKGATEEFIRLASLYQKYASSRGGVNWVVAYVQAAKETGYGKFGGVLDASYHNPCGLKESSGGSDTDPNAHKRFDNWDQGVIAHLDHLALYAGSAGYPKTNYVSSWNNGNLDSTSTYDSRHFKYLAGTVTTVNALGGKWAPSKTYGLEIFRLYCDLTGAKYLDARNNLDEPSNNAIITDDMLRVRGWAVHAFGIKEINVSLDGIYLGIANYGVSRPDIVNVYPAYFNSAESGYDTTFNISNISNGSKTLEMKIVANDGSYQTVTKTVNVNRAVLETKSFLDSPEENLNVTTDTIRVRGWALDSSGVRSVEVFVDGKSLGNISYGALRPDVNKVCPGYPSGDNAGFDETVNISSLSNGKKTLEIKITGNSGTVQTIKRTISINRKSLEAKSFLDSPEENLNVTTDTIRVRGWALDSSGVKSVEAFVDGKLLGNISYGALRPDVNKVCPGYPSGDNAGFDETVNISSLSNGKKTLEVKITGNSGTVQTIKVNFNKVTLESRKFLDEPTVNSSIVGTMTVRGWALSEAGTKEVRIKLDGQLLGKATINVTRNDVYNVHPEYNNKKSGFTATFDISKVSAGTKELIVEIEDNYGNVQIVTRKIKKSNKVVYIDAGHDYGGDRGAVRVINGVTYDETTLNIEVAEYLRTELINRGYEVIMARRMGERPTSSNYRENLWNRINAANNANADFYISIHQNTSTTTSANGVEAYYSSVKPDSLNDITYKLNTSKAVAASISSGIASALSMTNRGAKDEEFMVVKYTNMPAVLVECGFISNENEAKKISDSSNQKKIASVIADSIHNALK